MNNEEKNEDGINLSVLDILPKPLEDDHVDKAKSIREDLNYFVIEKGSKQGKNYMITDTWGFNYSYWRKKWNPW